MKVYKHLGIEERVKIALWEEVGLPGEEIAEELGRDKSTIYRELRRNSDSKTGRYVARNAQYEYRQRIKKTARRDRRSRRKNECKRKAVERLVARENLWPARDGNARQIRKS